MVLSDAQQIERRGAIVRLLRAGSVRRQADLVRLLKKEGYDATQSSISRDLRDLGVLKASGRYVLAPDVMTELGRIDPGAGGELQLVDAIRRTLATGKVVALEFEGEYYDTGTIPGYLKANLALALQREDLREDLLDVIRTMVDRDELSVRSGSARV